MTSVGDAEWGRLGAVWRETENVGAERWIRLQVDRHSRWLRMVVLIEIAVTVVVLAGATSFALTESGTAAMIVLSLGGAHAALVWGFALWNRAGIWKPLGETTRDYLDLARERCRREMRSARFATALIGVEVASMAVWVAVDDRWENRSVSPLSLVAAGLPMVVLLGALGWGGWSHRRARRRLAELDRVAVTLEV